MEEILDAWDALLPAALARFGARLVLLQAFLEGYRTGLFVKAPVRIFAPLSRSACTLECMHAPVREGSPHALRAAAWRFSGTALLIADLLSRDPILGPAAFGACQTESRSFC